VAHKISNIKYTKFLFILCSSILIINTAFAQQSTKANIRKVSRPEKYWAITHPFVFKKAIKITRHVLAVTDSIKHLTILDGDADGGQVDAFRHSYWLAMLTVKIGKRKALSLGKAHEKGNYLDFKKKKRKEIITSHDKIASDMDFFNNNIGAKIGLKMKNADKHNIQNAVIDSIIKGKMLIISKNKNNELLDCSGNIIADEQIQFKWITPKCLVPSDNKRN